ncbi:MAG TPA: hypothetical protein VHB21_19900, partial [Minicystis sp.]|nr:hypothetical protein [Minicystis sp.]
TKPSTVAVIAAELVLCSGVALAFAWSGRWTEILAAVVVGALATAATTVTVERGFVPVFAGAPRGLGAIVHLPRAAIVESVHVFRVLARHLLGVERAGSHVYAVRLEELPGDGREAAARAALLGAFGSATPAVIVYDVDLEARVVTSHRLDRGPGPDVLRRLGAGADAREEGDGT